MINEENYFLFTSRDQADRWVDCILYEVAGWVEKHSQGFWYLVLWYSKREGYLMKNVKQMEFCKLLVDECASVLPKDANRKTVYHNIEKYGYKDKLRCFDRLSETDQIRLYVQQLEDIFQTAGKSSETAKSDIEWCLTRHVKELYNSNRYEIFRHPNYEGRTFTMSVEEYMSQKFKNDRRPTYTTVFQCFDREVTKEDIYELSGFFSDDKPRKIFVASKEGFKDKVRSEAERLKIGLIRVCPENDRLNFLLPRSVDNGRDKELLSDMMEGKAEMTMPLLVLTDGQIRPSVDRLHVPILTNDEIERRADCYTRPEVEKFLRIASDNVVADDKFSCSISLYDIVIGQRVYYERGDVGESLSYFDADTKHVVLNRHEKPGSPHDRFSLAHELGHFALHSIWASAKQNCYSCLDSYEKGWMEHHANHFAACLLMPRAIMKVLYEHYFKQVMKTDVVQPLTIVGGIDADSLSRSVVDPIARRMDVSVKSAMIRLVKLGLAREVEVA